MESIKIIKRINEFYFSKDSLEENSTIIKTGEEVNYMSKVKHKLFIKDFDNSIPFILTYYGDETKHFRFDSRVFSQKELEYLSIQFNFDIIRHDYANELLVGSLHKKNINYRMNCLGAISEMNEKYYLLIFATRGTTAFEDDIVYVHGIWNEDLSSEIKHKFSL